MPAILDTKISGPLLYALAAANLAAWTARIVGGPSHRGSIHSAELGLATYGVTIVVVFAWRSVRSWRKARRTPP